MKFLDQSNICKVACNNNFPMLLHTFILQGYGQADHQMSTEILKKKYPDYSITFSNEGY